MTKAKPKILVIRGGAIGDFILTLPALRALRSQFPQAHLELLGYPHIAQLALAGGIVDRVQPIDARPLAGFFRPRAELASELVDYFSEFDLIVSYLFDPDEVFKTNIVRCAHGQYIVGPHRPDEKERLHATKVYLKPLERLAIFDADPVPQLSVSAQPATRNWLALHPGSGSERKNWPLSKWSQLLSTLVSETKLNLLLVGGEAEGDRLRKLADRLPAGRRAVAQSLPLAELAARLQACAGFVGHDSGITHLAAALGLPSLVLWADTIEEVWGPQGRVKIIREPRGIGGISVERVVRELTECLR